MSVSLRVGAWVRGNVDHGMGYVYSICLDRGRIAESGTYAELMEVEGGLLYQLVQGELPQLRSEVDPEEEALLLLHNPPSHARLFSEKVAVF